MGLNTWRSSTDDELDVDAVLVVDVAIPPPNTGDHVLLLLMVSTLLFMLLVFFRMC